MAVSGMGMIVETLDRPIIRIIGKKSVNGT